MIILQNQNSVSLNNSPFSLVPVNHYSTFCTYEFDYSMYLIEAELNKIYLFLIYLSEWLISLGITPSRLIHVIACVRTSFLFEAEKHSSV